MRLSNRLISMMNTQDDIFKRYLLDDATEDERIAVEERFITDDAAYDEMLAVEDELFYEYKEDELTPTERAVFERKFLATREGRDRLAFAGAFLETTADIARQKSFAVAPEAQPGILTSIAAFFSFGKAMKFGMAAAALVLSIGVIGLLIQNQRMRNDLAAVQQQNDAEEREREAQLAEKQRQQKEIEDQLNAEREKTTASEERIKELESEKNKLENEINERRRVIDRSPNVSQPGGQRTIATLVISPGLFTRSDGVPMNRVKLSPAATSLRVALRLKNINLADYTSYTLNATAVDSGNTILTRSGLRPGGRSKTLSLSIPANTLLRADYAITLSGVTKTGETEEITKYYFSVDK